MIEPYSIILQRTLFPMPIGSGIERFPRNGEAFANPSTVTSMFGWLRVVSGASTKEAQIKECSCSTTRIPTVL